LTKQLLRSLFDRYIAINPTKHPDDPSDTLHTNSKQQKTKYPTRTEHLPKTRLDESSYYEVYSIATP